MAEKLSVFDIIIRDNILTEEQMQESIAASNEQGMKLGEFLIQQKLLTSTQLTRAIAEVGGFPFVDLSVVDIEKSALQYMPESRARHFESIPVMTRDGAVLVATPIGRIQDIEMRDSLANMVSPNRLELAVAVKEEIQKAIKKNYRNDEQLRKITHDSSSDIPQEEEDDLSDFTEARSISPTVQLVDLVIKQAIADKASDIHFEPDEETLRVRYRLDGVLRDQSEFPIHLATSVAARIKVMCSLAIDETRKPQDGRLSVIGKNNEEMDLRVSILPLANGNEKIVMRILDNSNASLPLAKLGFSDLNLKRIQKSYKKPTGLILVTGPTGSGKSTTLYSVLNEISTPDINIITVEDPVEYTVARINQVQVNPNPKVGMTFANTLRSALRQDPDVILVGEMRDKETASTAMDASLTGHLVLSTLHTNDASSAVTRLAEMGVEPFLVASVLEAVVAQRLVRKLCIHCKEPYTPTEEEVETTGFEWDGEQKEIYRPAGCRECLDTGFLGRLAVHEVLTNDEEISHHIINRDPASMVDKAAKKNGMLSMKQDGWKKVCEGITSIQEVLRVVA